jgi:hypothetical protein
MNKDRYMWLISHEEGSLTDEEIAAGWHFCYDWDGLLIGPGMWEFEECCNCGKGENK